VLTIVVGLLRHITVSAEKSRFIAQARLTTAKRRNFDCRIQRWAQQEITKWHSKTFRKVSFRDYHQSYDSVVALPKLLLSAQMQGKPRVFISYCRSDGTMFATKLRQRLERRHSEIALWQDVISERGGSDWWLQITQALDQVEYMVLVLTPDAMKSPTVRKEWRYARQEGVCVYPIQGSSKLDFSSLPRWIRDQHIDDIGYDAERKKFTAPGQWQKFINNLNTPCETPRVPFMADDLPENFVERPCEFHQLVDLLRDVKREEAVDITVALHGTGGFGKTTLALALCHDERIQEVFDDGVLWTTLGENAGDLTSKIVDLIEVLSGERPGFKCVRGGCRWKHGRRRRHAGPSALPSAWTAPIDMILKKRNASLSAGEVTVASSTVGLAAGGWSHPLSRKSLENRCLTRLSSGTPYRTSCFLFGSNPKD
jgi:hypothetical protein